MRKIGPRYTRILAPRKSTTAQYIISSRSKILYTTQLNTIFFPFIFRCLQITVYAAYLFDAVMLYAKALDATLKENGSATDGIAIFNKLNGTFYKSKFILKSLPTIDSFL